MAKVFKPICLMVALALVLVFTAYVLPVSAKIVVDGLDFTGTPTKGDAPLTVEFEANDVYNPDYYEYTWDFGDGDSGSGQCTSHTYECAGVYDVTLTVTMVIASPAPINLLGGGVALAAADGDGEGITLTKEDYITVYPVADFTGDPTMGQAPLTVQFHDKSVGLCSGAFWDWNFGDGESSDSRNPTHTYTNAGTYTVTLTVSGSPSSTKTRMNYVIVDESGVPPTLVVSDVNINPTYAQSGEAIYITVTVANKGGAWGSEDIEMLINGQFEQLAPVGLAAGTSETISFTVYKTEAREYQVTIGDATGTFYIMEKAPQQTRSAGLLAGGELGTGGIIAIIVIGVILVGGVVAIFLFSRRPS